jgi:arginine decarboxylase
MTQAAGANHVQIDRFFAGPSSRGDQWRNLAELAEAWSSGTGSRAQFEANLADVVPTEEFHAYPGHQLIAALRDHAAANDAPGTAKLSRRITRALLTRSYRQHPGDWDADEDEQSVNTSVLPPTLGHGDTRRPYFEVLIVTGAPATRWPALATEWRRLRRPLDAFVYEPVFVGSFEDAFCATVLNPDLAAVIIQEGFPFRSRHDAPILRSLIADARQYEKVDTSALRLAQVIKRVRPELDLYLVSSGRVEEIAGSTQANILRRIFYAVEELLELHLSILEGVRDRYETPFFDNLKKYAQRPIGTFHALPIARGKSVFKSDWIRDMGEFYGINLFLAESSATTGGLDSLLEPTGNIKKAQDMAARAFGADASSSSPTAPRPRTRWSPGAARARRHRIVDRNCHKSHHYGMVLAGAQPLYVEAFPMTEYSMYGAVPLRRSSRRCSSARPTAGSTGSRWSTSPTAPSTATSTTCAG